LKRFVEAEEGALELDSVIGLLMGGIGMRWMWRFFYRARRSFVECSEFHRFPLWIASFNLTLSSPIPGAREKIASLRQRHRQLESSIELYELRVAEQAAQLSRMNRPRDFGLDDEPEDPEPGAEVPTEIVMTEDDLRREEEEIRELERKKRGLEERVNSMERDISGVLR
jgi:hypothetical protein